MFNIGYNVKRVRKAAGLTQKGLAKLTNISRPHIAIIESNHQIPSISTLQLIADALNVSIVELLMDEHEQKSSDLNEDEIKLLGAYRELDNEGKSAVKWMIKQHKPTKSVKSSTLPITGMIKQKINHVGLVSGRA